MYDFPTPWPNVCVTRREKRESRVVSGEQESASWAQLDDLNINVVLELTDFRLSNHLEIVKLSLFKYFVFSCNIIYNLIDISRSGTLLVFGWASTKIWTTYLKTHVKSELILIWIYDPIYRLKIFKFNKKDNF